MWVIVVFVFLVRHWSLLCVRHWSLLFEAIAVYGFFGGGGGEHSMLSSNQVWLDNVRVDEAAKEIISRQVVGGAESAQVFENFVFWIWHCMGLSLVPIGVLALWGEMQCHE